MKIETIEVGEKKVVVALSVSLHPVPVVVLAATCGKAVVRMRVTLHPKHDQTSEQFQKDVDRAVQQVAKEAAGHARSHELLAAIEDAGGK